MNTMSTFSYCLRAFLYIAIAMATQAATDLPSAFSGTPLEQTKFWLSVGLAGMIVWRSFIDRSSTEASAPVKTEITNTPSNPVNVEPVAKPDGNP